MNADFKSVSRSLSVRRGQSLAVWRSNALVSRGLQEIAQFDNKARAKELFDLGNACHHKDGYDQAIAYYTEAIRLHPNAQAYFARGAAYRWKGDSAMAKLDADEAARLGLRNHEPLKVFDPSPPIHNGVRLEIGEYGSYVTDGATNALFPRGIALEEVTLEYALELLKVWGVKSIALLPLTARRNKNEQGDH